MNFQDCLKSSKGSILSFYFWYSLYAINEKTINKPSVETYIWEFLKCDIFYIDGKCQKSGNCCKKLMLVKNGITLNTKEKFETIRKKDKKYDRFVPNYQNASKIKNFSCTCITPQNICSDYKGRPTLCKSYPFSIFIKDDKIPNTCGYYINIKTKVPKIRNASILKKIDNIIKNNNRCRILEEEL